MVAEINWEQGLVTWGRFQFSRTLILDNFLDTYPEFRPKTQLSSVIQTTIIEIPDIENFNKDRARLSLLFIEQRLNAVRITFLFDGEAEFMSDDDWGNWSLVREFERLMLSHKFLREKLGLPNGEIKSLWDYDIKQLNDEQLKSFNGWTYRFHWGHVTSTYSADDATSCIALGYTN